MSNLNNIFSIGSEHSDIWGIVPVKAFDLAKQRLRGVLSHEERQSLAVAMLSDVLAETSQAKRLSGFVVVSRDVKAIEIGHQFGARVLSMRSDTNLSSAVTAAARLLASEGVGRVLTIPGDVPLISSVEVDLICDSLVSVPNVTLLPNRDESGTNCIAVSPPNAMPFEFGPASFQRHCLSAKQSYLDSRIMRLPGFALDIDVPDDVLTFLDNDDVTATREYLRSSGIAARLSMRSAHEYRQSSDYSTVQDMV
jgi:2-phospho-L-lactate guanylyltransferase